MDNGTSYGQLSIRREPNQQHAYGHGVHPWGSPCMTARQGGQVCLLLLLQCWLQCRCVLLANEAFLLRV
eukprot:jgi/Botrbrau1/7077/Bobra.0165s0099.1